MHYIYCQKFLKHVLHYINLVSIVVLSCPGLLFIFHLFILFPDQIISSTVAEPTTKGTINSRFLLICLLFKCPPSIFRHKCFPEPLVQRPSIHLPWRINLGQKTIKSPLKNNHIYQRLLVQSADGQDIYTADTLALYLYKNSKKTGLQYFVRLEL